MTDLLTAAQMRRLEQEAMDSGRVTGLELMERAGIGVVEAIFEEWPEMQVGRAMVLCGPGNNGGDGFVVARHLSEQGWAVEVRLFGDAAKLPPDARTNYERWCEIGDVGPFEDGLVIEDHTLIVDAIFGIGQTRALPDFMESFAAHAVIMTGVGPARMVAVDVPSGIETDSGKPLGQFQFFADLTVTFHRMKPCHISEEGRERSGKIVVKDIGL